MAPSFFPAKRMIQYKVSKKFESVMVGVLIFIFAIFDQKSVKDMF
jgi:hypothetical protein